MKKRIIIILLITCCCFVFIYLYVFEKPHRDYIEEKASFELSAVNLLLNFQNNESSSNTMYLNELVQIQGKITSIQKSNPNIIIDDRVFCIFNGAISNTISEGEIVTVKGRCTGYDDIFLQVTLDNCIIIK